MAYQIGFELYENAPQGFLNTVAQSLRGVTPSPLPADVSSTPAEAATTEEENQPSTSGEKKPDNSPTGKLCQILMVRSKLNIEMEMIYILG